MENLTEQGRSRSRRGFLQGVGATALGAGLFGVAGAGPFVATARAAGGSRGWGDGHSARDLMSFDPIRADPRHEVFWDKVAKAFALPDNYIHMNTGTTGSQPRFVHNNLAVYNFYKNADPRDWQANLNRDFPGLFPIAPSAIAARQAQVAEIYGADPSEIVLSYNTTDGCNLIFGGTPWKPGDRIVTTNLEHPALNGPIAWARDYHGVEVAIVDIPSNFTSSISVAEVLSWFDAELSKPLGAGNKQYLAISEIFYKNGVRVPVKALCDLVRSRGGYSIIDTAHGWGMLPVNCHEYGADFICGAGHKWLCGGPGTGILYVRQSGPNLPPYAPGNYFQYGNPFTQPSANFDNRTWSPAGLLQSRGETNVPALFAMTDSLSFFNHVGVQNIYERGVALSTYLKEKIAARWGESALWVQHNPDPEFHTFLTSFNPFRAKDDPGEYAAMNTAINAILPILASGNPKIYIRSITWRDRHTDPADNRVGFRISTHAMYNSPAQVDFVFDRLAALIDSSGLPQLR